MPFLAKKLSLALLMRQLRNLDQDGHGTGKTGNLDVDFSRQGKHRELSYFNFYTAKIVATQGKF